MNWDKNLINAISPVIFVASYTINIRKLTQLELLELDQVIKSKKKKIIGWPSSDTRLHMKRSVGGRGLMLLRKIFKETRLACCIFMTGNKWIKAAWRSKTVKENNSIIKAEEVLTINLMGI